jgi:hemoglobin
MSNPLKMFEITADQIDLVVRAFYTRVRRDPNLAPIFAAHIDTPEWPTHEAKIARFWRNAILREGCYSGNPMRVHLQTPEIQPEHFALWLGLFDEVVAQELPAETARAFSALAHRIGDGFRFGIEQMRQPAGAPPILR